MRKPLIGVTCDTFSTKNGRSVYGIRPSYTHAIEASGGLPLLIVPDLSAESLRIIYEKLDGVLLTGGGDVVPTLYGAPDDMELRGLDANRDASEINITRWAMDDDKPLLGICRGIQVINVALGGTLYRDLASEYGKTVDHDLTRPKPGEFKGHSVAVERDSRLAALLGETQPAVNSFHHQAIRALGNTLRPVATSPDGVIEGIERDDSRFFVAVQWHPEELYDESEPMRRLFSGFVTQAANGNK
jgi:putative glutamine amidotransferase